MMNQPADAAVPTFEIDWYRSVPWWRFLSRSITISWRGTHLLVCGLAIVLTQIGWDLGNRLFLLQPGDFGPSPWSAFLDFDKPTDASTGLLNNVPFNPASFNVIRLNSSENAESNSIGSNSIGMTTWWGELLMGINPIAHVWLTYVEPISRIAQPLTIRRLAFGLFIFLWTSAVWSIVGGVLARRSVVELGTQTAIGWTASIKLVASRWTSLMWSLSMPVIGCFLLALAPLVLGLIGRLGVPGQILAGIGMVPTFLFSLGIGWLIAIAALGFPLMVAAIVSEKNADAFDGFSRTGAYLFQRPMTLAVALLFATAACLFAQSVAGGVILFGRKMVTLAFEVGVGTSLRELLVQMNWGAGILNIGYHLIELMVRAIPYSFFWTAAAAVYLTLRHEVDHTDMDDLDLGDASPAKPLPPLQQA